MASHALATTVTPSYDDFSGIDMSAFSNPYDALIAASNDDPEQIQARYSQHREARNAAQKAKLLAPGFAGVMVDPILLRLEDPSVEPGFVDTRNCLVFWARPPDKVQRLVRECQERLRDVVPNLWLMPPTSLHMTALEITHSRTPPEIDALAAQMRDAMPAIASSTAADARRRARLVRPLLGFDASAVALSFVPAARGEGLAIATAADGASTTTTTTTTTDTGGRSRNAEDDAYTYHHLRRDLFAAARATGVAVDSRYVVPSAHLTVARFVREEDFWVDGDEDEDGADDGKSGQEKRKKKKKKRGVVDGAKVRRLVERIEEVNAWLRAEFWPREEGGGDGAEPRRIREGGEWVVGEGKGLDCRRGALWYGSGGETIVLGEGF